MRFTKMIPLILALSCGGFSARQASASQDQIRTHAAATSKHKKKKKSAKKSKSKSKTHARHATKSSKRSSASAGKSHYPTQPGGSGFAEIPNEKKDDLPAPNTAGK